MARINRSDILKTITQGSGKDFYLFEIVINRFFAEMQRQINSGNVVSIKGVGSFYMDVKKKRVDRPTYGTNPDEDRFNSQSTYDKNITHSNLKTFERLPPPFSQFVKSSKNNVERGDGLYAFAGYATLKFKASRNMGAAHEVLRFRRFKSQRKGGVIWTGNAGGL